MHLSDEQIYYLKFMRKYLNYDVNQIRDHISMINEKTNKAFQKRSIKMWLDRLDQTGDVKKKPKSGGPRLLSKVDLLH